MSRKQNIPMTMDGRIPQYQAVRLTKITLDRRIGVPIKPASAYLMKHPIEQTSDVAAKTACEKFVADE